MVPRKQAGHMTCTRPQAERQNLLAMRASSTHDPEQTYCSASATVRIRNYQLRSAMLRGYVAPGS